MKQSISAMFVTGLVALVLVAGARAGDVPAAGPPVPFSGAPPAPTEASWPACWWAGWFHKPQCVCEPETKKVPHVIYDCRCEKFCGSVCACGLLGKLFGCDCCECEHACGKVRTRHVLLKKTVTEECPGFKCVVPYCTECVFPASPKH